MADCFLDDGYHLSPSRDTELMLFMKQKEPLGLGIEMSYGKPLLGKSFCLRPLPGGPVVIASRNRTASYAFKSEMKSTC